MSGVSDERIVELYAEAEIAVIPSLYEGFSLPAVEAMACGVPLVTTTGGALPEVVGPPGESAMLVPPADPDALATQIVALLDDAGAARAASPTAAGAACSTASPGGGPPKAPPSTTTSSSKRTHGAVARRRGRAELLTVDFDRLGLVAAASDSSTSARAAAATCSKAMRRGARVTALDYSAADLKDAVAVAGAMLAGGEVTNEVWAGAVNGDALQLPFADDTFDRIVVSEVLEHIWDDERAIVEVVRVLRPGGRVAATVPTRWPERVAWALNAAVPRHARRPRPHLPSARARAEARTRRAVPARLAPRARVPLAVLVAEVRVRPRQHRGRAGEALPRLPLLPDRAQPALGERARSGR